MIPAGPLTLVLNSPFIGVFLVPHQGHPWMVPKQLQLVPFLFGGAAVLLWGLSSSSLNHEKYAQESYEGTSFALLVTVLIIGSSHHCQGQDKSQVKPTWHQVKTKSQKGWGQDKMRSMNVWDWKPSSHIWGIYFNNLAKNTSKTIYIYLVIPISRTCQYRKHLKTGLGAKHGFGW